MIFGFHLSTPSLSGDSSSRASGSNIGLTGEAQTTILSDSSSRSLVPSCSAPSFGRLVKRGKFLHIQDFDLSFFSHANADHFTPCRNNSSDLLTIIGAMYAAVLFVGINNCSTVQPIVSIERTVFYRERAAGMYSSLPYAIAQVKKSTLSI